MKKVVLMFIPALICGVIFTSFGSNKAEPKEVNTLQTNESVEDSIFVVRYKEFNQIIESCMSEKDGKKFFNLGSVSKDDLNRLKELFLSMSPEQQETLNFTFRRRVELIPAEKIPMREEYESWKIPTEYGIWLDGKRIENSELNSYQPSDFSYFSVSRLLRNAKDYGKYVYHLELNTAAYFEARKASAEADKTLYLMPNRPKT